MTTEPRFALDMEIAQLERRLEVLRAAKRLAELLPAEQGVNVLALVKPTEAASSPDPAPTPPAAPPAPEPLQEMQEAAAAYRARQERLAAIKARTASMPGECIRRGEGDCDQPLMELHCDACDFVIIVCAHHVGGKAMGGLKGGHGRNHQEKVAWKVVTRPRLVEPLATQQAVADAMREVVGAPPAQPVVPRRIELPSPPPPPPEPKRAADEVQCKFVYGDEQKECNDWVPIHKAQKHLEEVHGRRLSMPQARLFFNDPRLTRTAYAGRTESHRTMKANAKASDDSEDHPVGRNGKLRERLIELGRLPAPAEPEGPPRPRVRADCAEGPRPCPWVSCRYHLYLDVNPETGSIKLNFPDVEPSDMDRLRATCTLDVADMDGFTLESVGDIMNLTRERIRQIETRGMLNLKMRMIRNERYR